MEITDLTLLYDIRHILISVLISGLMNRIILHL